MKLLEAKLWLGPPSPIGRYLLCDHTAAQMPDAMWETHVTFANTAINNRPGDANVGKPTYISRIYYFGSKMAWN